jgi:hypothetical protein
MEENNNLDGEQQPTWKGTTSYTEGNKRLDEKEQHSTRRGTTTYTERNNIVNGREQEPRNTWITVVQTR